MGLLSSTGKSKLQDKGFLNNHLQIVRDNKQVKQIFFFFLVRDNVCDFSVLSNLCDNSHEFVFIGL